MKQNSAIAALGWWPALMAALLGLWFAPRATAQTNGSFPTGVPAYRVYTDKDGLPLNSLECLALDRQGYLWVGTQDGAAHYNGRVWKTVNMPNPTASNFVRDIAVGQDGSLWFATLGDGVACFKDGGWTTFNQATSGIPSNRVRTIIESRGSQGNSLLWIGTDQGLTQFDRGTWTTFTPENSGLPNLRVNALRETSDSSGTRSLWVGTDSGLARFDGRGWEVLNSENLGLPDNQIRCLIATRSAEGNLVIWSGGNSGGLVRIEEIRGQASSTPTVKEGVPGLENPKPGNRMADRYSVTVFDTKNSGLPQDTIRALIATNHLTDLPVIWIGTQGGGLARLEETRGQGSGARGQGEGGTSTVREGLDSTDSSRWRWTVYNTRNSNLPNNVLRCFLEIPNQAGRSILMIGTNNGGLVRFAEQGWKTLTTQNSDIPDNGVWSILETTGANGQPVFWFGTNGGGLARLENGQWTTFNSRNSNLRNDVVMSVIPARAGGLWIGTRGGLYRLEGTRWTLFDTQNSGLPDAIVYSLLETTGPTGQSVLWAGTANGGLARFEAGKWQVLTPANSPLPQQTVLSLRETVSTTGKRTLWVGTNGGGVAAITPTESGTDQWEVFDTRNSVFQNRSVFAFCEVTAGDGSRWLWAGTQGGGVFRLKLDTPTRQWVSVVPSLTQPLPNETVYQIRQDRFKRVYLFTNKGIACLLPRPNAIDQAVEFDVRSFSSEDGLPGNECNAGASLIDSQGRVWGGTVTGVAIFDPSQLTIDSTPKVLRLEHLRVNRTEAVIPSGTSFDHTENSFLFEFALLSFFREADTRYRFQLEGFDPGISSWSPVASKEYTNLSEGRYVFKVWGRDYAGNESGPVSFAFEVRPAPWRTWWAHGLYLLLAAGILWGGVRWRLQSLRRSNQLLEAKITERTAELAQAMQETEFKNEQLQVANAHMQQAKEEVERKNQQLDRNVAELAKKNNELIASQQQADRIFSAFATALPGTVLDNKYRLDEMIGTGGFGAVFKGTHLQLSRPIAIKVFRPSPGNDSPEGMERFRREGISACRVSHPNAVQVFDSGISKEGIAYLVMELLDGHSLASEIRRYGRLSLRRCTQILIPVCNVLAEVHAVGIIHRDIKPDNIFIHFGKEGETVKVVDFGIAKLVGEDTENVRLNLTVTGGLVGTPTYMSPERLRSQPYDQSADIYSLGITIYEMIAGLAPFQFTSGNLFDFIIRRLSKAPVPLRTFAPHVPESLEILLMQALTGAPSSRPTALELEQAFRALLVECPADVLDYEGERNAHGKDNSELATLDHSNISELDTGDFRISRDTSGDTQSSTAETLRAETL